MNWYVPSFYGDISLKGDKESCEVSAERLTQREKEALKALDKKLKEGTTTLAIPLQKAAKIIAKALKPNRKLVSAVRFSDGKMEEVTDLSFKEDKKPAAATTVARPVLGCPAPDFVSAEIKARRVLEVFLTDEQREDFRCYNRFITVGGETGHRYMVTSRHARDQLLKIPGHRSLFDLDKQQEICCHDWTVPAAEEMLALHLFVSMPGYEGLICSLE